MLLLHTREMWATKQTFHYNWSWKQVASIKAPSNFHKNKMILYWSYRGSLFPLCPCTGILEASSSHTEAALVEIQCHAPGYISRGDACQHWITKSYCTNGSHLHYLNVAYICKLAPTAHDHCHVTWFTPYMTILHQICLLCVVCNICCQISFICLFNMCYMLFVNACTLIGYFNSRPHQLFPSVQSRQKYTVFEYDATLILKL